MARLLLDYNADPTIRTADGDTVLHKAARWNQLDIIKLLLTIGVDVSAQDNVSMITETRLPHTIQEQESAIQSSLTQLHNISLHLTSPVALLLPKAEHLQSFRLSGTRHPVFCQHPEGLEVVECKTMCLCDADQGRPPPKASEKALTASMVAGREDCQREDKQSRHHRAATESCKLKATVLQTTTKQGPKLAIWLHATK